jgi:hypothetical protein
MDKSMKGILDEFGTLLMDEVRDTTCLELDKLTAGAMADEGSKAFYDEYRKIRLEPSEAACIRRLVQYAVTLTLGNFLQFLDSNEIPVLFRGKKGRESHNITEISDGLMGELFTEDGWIARFSGYKDTLGL